MYWITFRSSSRKIAENDIIVYKILKEGCKSYFYDFQYEIGKLYTIKSELQVIKKDLYFINEHIIEKGFHSYAKDAIDLELKGHPIEISYPDGIISKCTIPKGSEYYINEVYDIVSNKIIINKCY